MPFWARKDWADMTMHERVAQRERRQKNAADKYRHAVMKARYSFKVTPRDEWLCVDMPVHVNSVHRLSIGTSAERDKKIRTECRKWTMYAFMSATVRRAYGNPGLITIIRVSPSKTESDSLRRITEPARDGIADVFAGQNDDGVWLGHYWDADQRPGACQWAYEQEQLPGVFGLRILFTPR
jgi:hypothetical protein